MSSKAASALPTAPIRVNALITTQLVEALGPKLLRFAQRSTRTHADAEDAVQEMWACALRANATYEGRASLATWLTGVMRRRIADRFRREGRELPYNEEAHIGEAAFEGDKDLREAMLRVEQGLVQLSSQERRVFTLCDVELIDRDEAAQRLGINRGHLRVLLYRARARLARHLQRSGFGHDDCLD